MFTKKVKAWLIVVSFLLAIVVAFFVGDSIGQRAMLREASVQLDGIQAALALNRIEDQRELITLLSKSCVKQAQSVLDFEEDRDTALLSGFFKGKLDSSDIKYITDRDQNLVKSLSSFRSKYGSRWEVPECK